MNIPPPEEWITFAEAAQRMRIGRTTVYHIYRRGKKGASGKLCTLKAWRTPLGFVTTLDEIDRLIDDLNREDEE